MRLVFKSNVGFNQTPAALYIDVVEAVDQNVGDGIVFEQRLQRAQSKHFVLNFLNNPIALGGGHRDTLVQYETLD